LDEPFSSLDSNLKNEMRRLVTRLQRETNITTTLVTHDREDALGLADKVAFMDGGKILQTGVPQEIYEHPCCPEVADYFGNNFYLTGKVEGGAFISNVFTFPVNVLDGRYRAMLRSNMLEICDGTEFRVESVTYGGEISHLCVRHERTGKTFTVTVSAACNAEIGVSTGVRLKYEKAVLYREVL
jgi:ABC-type Fe3+/spermidine/putrescine transport system ATPase subunit